MELNKAMEEIAKLNEAGGKGTVKLQGKTYTNVSTRVEVFRKHLGLSLGIETEVLFPIKGVMMIARVKDKDGFVIGSGHAYAESLAKDKSLEKLESVAVGRAMASLGLSGGEYASDSEIETWPERYESKGIGIDMPTEGFDPTEWINERMTNLQAFVIEGKRPTQDLFSGRVFKIENDPLFNELSVAQHNVWLKTKEALQTKLTERLKEKEEA